MRTAHVDGPEGASQVHARAGAHWIGGADLDESTLEGPCADITRLVAAGLPATAVAVSLMLPDHHRLLGVTGPVHLPVRSDLPTSPGLWDELRHSHRPLQAEGVFDLGKVPALSAGAWIEVGDDTGLVVLHATPADQPDPAPDQGIESPASAWTADQRTDLASWADLAAGVVSGLLNRQRQEELTAVSRQVDDRVATLSTALRRTLELPDPVSDPRLPRMLDVVHERLTALDVAADDLSTLLQPAELQEPRNDNVDLVDVLRRVLSQLRVGLDGRRLRHDLPTEPLWVRTDAASLHRVLVELVGAALYHLAPSDEVRVRVGVDDAARVYLVSAGRDIPCADLMRVVARVAGTGKRDHTLAARSTGEVLEVAAGPISVLSGRDGTSFELAVPLSELDHAS